MVSKLFQEIDQKVAAFEQLEQMMKYCDYQIVSCTCGNVDNSRSYTIHYSAVKRMWIVRWVAKDDSNSCPFVTLAQAIAKFAELTEH